MRFVTRGLLFTLLLAMVAACIGTWIGIAAANRGSDSPSMHAFVHEELQLSADQERRLEAIEARYAERRRLRETELRAANVQLAAAIQERHAYSPEVQAAVDRIHRAMGELQKETILHVLEMRTVLTPNQAAQFDERISEALTEQSR